MQADHENLAALRKEIQESIERVRRSIEITRGVFMRDVLLGSEELTRGRDAEDEARRRSA